MSDVKLFRVIGEIVKPNLRTPFQKKVRAVKPEDAIEEVYMMLGSKHRVKRFYIKIQTVEEVMDEVTDEFRDTK